MFNLSRFLKNYKIPSVIAPLFKFLEACFELFVPLIMADIIDVGVKNADKNYIYIRALLLLLLGAAGLVFALIAQYFSAKAAMGFGREVRSSLFAHILSLPQDEADKYGSSKLITLLTNDVNLAQTGINMFLRLFLRSPFIVAGAVFMASTIDFNVTLMFLLVSVSIGAVMYFVMNKSMPINKKIQESLDNLGRKTRENLGGIRVIRAFSQEENENKQLENADKELASNQLRRSKIDSLLNPFTYVILNLAVIAVLSYGSFEIDGGSLTQGEVIAFINYLGQILIAIVALANFVVIITRAETSAKRINSVFDIKGRTEQSKGKSTADKEDTDTPGRDSREILRVENLSFSYAKNGEYALNNINFTLNKGEKLGIIGGTGAGKSTLLALIARMYEPQKGRIYLKERDIKDFSEDRLYENIMLVRQKENLFSGSVFYNMTLGNKEKNDEFLWKCLEDAQAKEFIQQKNKGLDHFLAEGGVNLSGGQKQRLFIARALAARPQILMLDDSFSALDYATEAKLKKALSSYENTMIIVTQRLSSISNCDKILVLDDGYQAGLGTHDFLMQSCPQYMRLYELQTKRGAK